MQSVILTGMETAFDVESAISPANLPVTTDRYSRPGPDSRCKATARAWRGRSNRTSIASSKVTRLLLGVSVCYRRQSACDCNGTHQRPDTRRRYPPALHFVEEH